MLVEHFYNSLANLEELRISCAVKSKGIVDHAAIKSEIVIIIVAFAAVDVIDRKAIAANEN